MSAESISALTWIKEMGVNVGAARWLEQNLTNPEVLALRAEVEIRECGEPIVPIPAMLPRQYLRIEDHPYVEAGAPYGHHHPFALRETVVGRLLEADRTLQSILPGHRLQIFDGYRPLRVQEYMYKHTTDLNFAELIKSWSGKADPTGEELDQIREQAEAQTQEVWALPTWDESKPTPHSTGGAVDLTIIGPDGYPLNMGSEIDARYPIGTPNFFENQEGEAAKMFHRNRRILFAVMSAAGFKQLPHEWWHFCYGDQVWARLNKLENPHHEFHAMYGRYDLVEGC